MKTSYLARLLLLLFLLTACHSTRTIVNGLNERDANEIIVLLAQNHITAYKIQEKTATGAAGPKIVLWDISVDAKDTNQAMSILSLNGLPRKESPNLIDLFSSSGLVPSDMTEKIRYQAGLADTIANMIRKMDGVVDADVRLSFPEEDPLNPQAKLAPITASVYVKHTGILDDPNSHLISKIKQLVSSSVSGLSYDNVTVIPDRARFAISSSIMTEAGKGEYVKFLGFVISKGSVVKFQIFFGLVIALILFMILAVGALFWKINPLLKRRGGYRELLHLTPLPEVATLVPQVAAKPQEAAKPAEAPPAEKKEEPPPAKG